MGPGRIDQRRRPGADTTLITHGMYWRNLGVYRRHFRDEQILVVFLEDFSRPPQRELGRCFSHIGVDTDVTVQDADRPRNQSSGFRRDRALAEWLRHSGMVSWARELLPDPLFSAGKELLTEPNRYSAEWDAETKRRVASEFEEDARRFLEYCGKSPSFWSLSGG